MRPSETFERNRALIREIVSRHKATNPRVFGSVLHGTDREGSDLDILVDALPGATLFDIGGLEADLQDALGVRVQVTTSGGLHHLLRDKVLSEASQV